MKPPCLTQKVDDFLHSYREETALEKKLDKLAGQIGQVGLGAASFSLLAMAGQFSYYHFVVDGEQWQWDYLTTYLHFLITAITIVVCKSALAKMSHADYLQQC